MKTTQSLLSLAAVFGCAAANHAYLYTIDQGTIRGASSQVASISSNIASSIIARRRGLAGSRYLGTADESIIEDINQYGGFQVPLFGAGADETPAKIFMRISGFEGSISEFPSLPDLWIEEPTRDLLDDFKARKNVDGVCEYDLSVPTKDGVDIVYSYIPSGSNCLSAREVRDLPAILTVYSTVPTGKNVGKGMSTLLRTLSHLSMSDRVESTILILPSASKMKKSKVLPRGDVEEEPLELSTGALEASSDTQPARSAANTSHALPKFVPECYTKAEACQNQTNSCSGHGECYRAYAGCYKCKCSPTVIRRSKDGGQQVIQWGGYACQKKDISVPFVLFASVGVFLTALVAGGIGMLYSMGAQELPSVIGAGVGGPKAQK